MLERIRPDASIGKDVNFDCGMILREAEVHFVAMARLWSHERVVAGLRNIVA